MANFKTSIFTIVDSTSLTVYKTHSTENNCYIKYLGDQYSLIAALMMTYIFCGFIYRSEKV